VTKQFDLPSRAKFCGAPDQHFLPVMRAQRIDQAGITADEQDRIFIKQGGRIALLAAATAIGWRCQPARNFGCL